MIDSLNRSLSSRMVMPAMTGIDIKKENFAASSDLMPSASAKEMVLPERDIPGKIAKA